MEGFRDKSEAWKTAFPVDPYVLLENFEKILPDPYYEPLSWLMIINTLMSKCEQHKFTTD